MKYIIRNKLSNMISKYSRLKRLFKLWPFDKLNLNYYPTIIYISHAEVDWLPGERIKVVGVDEDGIPICEVNPDWRKEDDWTYT